ncbi:MAG: restriction endonuclease [Calditrichaeota bacterium]|nr:MAG: restriction endonuclease [Calditrichota bacterium]
MTKMRQAQEILQALGLPPKQQNEISALTFLVLAQLSENVPWKNARRKSLRIHDILQEIKERYGRQYAENTRETIRRQVIHQFIQAGIVVRNPDQPNLPTNSPLTHYALTEPALRVVRAYGTPQWEESVQQFLEQQIALIERYERRRTSHYIPLKLPTGEKYFLSPGAHNQLQAEIINKFGPIFVPKGLVLYVGDAENKTLHVEKEYLAMLGFPITTHHKLPDVVLYDPAQNRLFLIEAVTSHGPVSHKRLMELEQILQGCKGERVYVSAFPDFKEFARHLQAIAWDTEVWIANNPHHLIHFNGGKFLTPHSS